jgi:hypothetical protein
MDADGRENIRIGGSHDRRRCTASRETCDIDSSRVGEELLKDLHGDAGDERWLAALALLVTGIEPVPAFLHVCRLGLTRIAERRARALAVGHAGALAFSRTGDPATGEFKDGVALAQFGEVDLDSLRE